MVEKAIIHYTFDPVAQSLTIWQDGKPRGGFRGEAAQRRFLELQDDETIIITDMETKNKHSKLVRMLRAMWIKQGIDDYRGDILRAYGVYSTTDLSVQQLEELIKKYRNTPPANDNIRRLRSEALTVLNKIGIYADNDDWSSVNNYMMDKRIAGKLMYQMDEYELQGLIRKLRSILRKRTQDIRNNPQLN